MENRLHKLEYSKASTQQTNGECFKRPTKRSWKDFVFLDTQTETVGDIEVTEKRCEKEATKELEDEVTCKSVAPDDDISFGETQNDSKDEEPLQTTPKTFRVSDDFENEFIPDYETDDIV